MSYCLPNVKGVMLKRRGVVSLAWRAVKTAGGIGSLKHQQHPLPALALVSAQFLSSHLTLPARTRMASSSPQAAGLLSSPTTTASLTPYAAGPASEHFQFPSYISYPPLYTIQPNLATQSKQMAMWSSLIASYCAHYRLFILSLSSLPADLFHEASIRRSLGENDIRKVLDWMARPENGARAEWIPSTTRNGRSSTCYIYWRTPAEWADLIYAWIDETGQKGTILTLYELHESDAVSNKDWRNMEEDLLKKVLNVLVKRGKAQIFGQEETSGIKFF